MYKLIISDLDGTLLNSEHELTRYTKNTVKKLLAKGIKFFIATGRHHIDAMDIKNKLGLKEAYLISSNGARVHDYEGNLLLEYNHNEKIAKEIINMSISSKVHLNVYFDDNWYVFRENDRIKEWVEKTTFKYTQIKIEELKYDKILKWYYLGDHEDLVEVKDKIEKNWGQEVQCLFSLPICLEIMPKGISKGRAIEEIILKEGISRKDTMAFGDGFNDYDMLNFVQKGLVMENAHVKLKESLPHLEIIGHHSKDAVAKYLESHFSL